MFIIWLVIVHILVPKTIFEPGKMIDSPGTPLNLVQHKA